MTTEQQRPRKRAVVRRRPGPRRTIKAGGIATAAVVLTLAACGNQPAAPSAGASPGGTGASTPGSPPPTSQSPTSQTPTAQSPSTEDPTTTPDSTASSGGTSKPQDQSTGGKPTGSGAGDPASCSNLAGKLSLDQQIGQLFMAATSSSGMTASEARQLASLKIGSVILLGNSTAGRSAIEDVTSSIKHRVGSDHGVKVLLAADQEGGMVQRLAGLGFDTIPSAEEQASLSDDHLQSDAKLWGRQLKRAGINANLAPVSDVVPTSIGTANQPIGALHRGYGPDPDVVAHKNVAFIKGMESAGIATSVKHFPGLGIVRGNTDVSTDVTDNETTRHDKRLAGFRAGVTSGVDMVMVSSAVYSKIDPDHPAAFSKTVQQDMIRNDLGFDGVIISDDLLGKALSGTAVRNRALRFVRAGGDLSIVGQSSEVEPMVDALRHAAGDDPALRSKIEDAATRVLIMKARHGLADCTGS